MFHVQVTVQVNHDDRDVEFIALKSKAQGVFESLGEHTDLGVDFGLQSCEMLGRKLMAILRNNNIAEVVEVQVSEDGENGAIVGYSPE
jgi:hypothetical protein